MKEGIIEKSASTATREALEAIGAYTRRPLAEDEVYTFSLVLCDNEVDRDWERFSIPALEALSKLFVGKTGIFDHDPKGRNQTARIYQCRVDRTPGKTTTAGEPYSTLRAEAYMVRSEKNRDLILEIDAGIKKEVSIGCAMARGLCSVCGQDRKQEPCSHRPGQKCRAEQGGDTLCHTVLCDPVDAYEWSFVAVPAQPAAGVTKQLRKHVTTLLPGNPAGEEADPSLLLKQAAEGNRSLSPGDAARMLAGFARLEEEAEQGRAWREKAKKEALRLGGLAEPDFPRPLLEKTLAPLSPRELDAWAEHFRRKAARRLPLVQTAGGETDHTREEFSQFKL